MDAAPVPDIREPHRVLEEQKFRRLGGIKDIEVDIRIITATNRNLQQLIEQGRFRLDLYYRLNVIQLTIPGLRDRRDDLMPLASHFLSMFGQRLRREIKGFSSAAEAAILQHDWPGNVRELRNAVERAVVLEDGSLIQQENLGLRTLNSTGSSLAAPSVAIRNAAPVESMSLEVAERTLLLNALDKSAWNQNPGRKAAGHHTRYAPLQDEEIRSARNRV